MLCAFLMNRQSGFTLIELVMVIVVLGILAAVAIPQFGDMTDSSKIAATKKELQEIKRAIVGNADIFSGGQLVDRGFEGDVGFTPSLLSDLGRKPDSVSVWNKLTRLGWNGPYIDTSGGNYLTDSWGTGYVYVPAQRKLMSIHGSDTIAVSF
ncbi:MAG: prepilin-type N-terminal cleavage/methylation domain-containing protein [Candidatus Zixiibacteriota bacterium]